MTDVAAPGVRELVEDLRLLVTCESPSHDHDALRRSAEAVAALGVRLLDAEPERLVRDGVTHVRWRFGAGDRVLLLGHHDTVWPLGSLEAHPWAVRDGRASGPGCFDMAAGVVQMLHAAAGLVDRDGVTVLVTGDEELGAATSRDLVEAEARRTGVVLCFEGSADGGALKTARKGASVYELTVRGAAAHAGLEPDRGVNATVVIARLVLDLQSLADPASGTTVTPTTVSSGTSANTVPARGVLHVDVRTRTATEQERVHDAVGRLRPALPRAGLDVRRLVHHPPLEPRSSAALLAVARDVAREQGLGPVTGAAVGGASDANLAAATGALTLDGLGAVGGGAHAPDEHVVVEAMPDRVRLAAGVIERVLAGRLPIDAQPDPAGARR